MNRGSGGQKPIKNHANPEGNGPWHSEERGPTLGQPQLQQHKQHHLNYAAPTLHCSFSACAQAQPSYVAPLMMVGAGVNTLSPHLPSARPDTPTLEPPNHQQLARAYHR